MYCIECQSGESYMRMPNILIDSLLRFPFLTHAVSVVEGCGDI